MLVQVQQLEQERGQEQQQLLALLHSLPENDFARCGEERRHSRKKKGGQ
jgi:hypothetical protein